MSRHLKCRTMLLIGLALVGVLMVALVVLLVWLHRTPPPFKARDRWLPGNSEWSFEYGGRTRTFRLHIPPGYDGSTPLPLIIALHGGTGSARQFERSSGIDDGADRLGFIVVYPNGTGTLKSWNAGYCCGSARENNVDDVGFIRALIAALSGTLHINPDRLYATGMSNGAMLTYRLAAEASDLFAAVGPVAGSIGGQVNAESPLWMIPAPAAPVSIIAIHGKEDESVRYDGGRSSGVFGRDRIDLSVANSIAFWRGYDNCATPPQTEISHGGNVIRDTATCPDGVEVVLYTIVDGDHSWPGAQSNPLTQNHPNQDISAADLILEFFASHSKP